jgi:hypothetical protein
MDMSLMDEIRKSRQTSWRGILAAMLGMLGLASLFISLALLVDPKLVGFYSPERQGQAAIAAGLFAVAAAISFGFVLISPVRK